MKAWRIWLLGIAVAGGLAVLVVVLASRGDGAKTPDRRDSSPRLEMRPSPEPAVASPAGAAPRQTSPVGNPEPVATGAGKPSAGTDGSPVTAPGAPDASDPWERIPLDSGFGESLGDIPTRRAFSLAMRTPQALGACTEGWRAPPGIVRIDMKTELRVRSEQDALVVEDAVLRESSIGDADLERCLLASLRGRRVDAPGIQPGQAFRLAWRSVKGLR